MEDPGTIYWLSSLFSSQQNYWVHIPSPLLALILGCLSKTIVLWINKHHKSVINHTGPSSSKVISELSWSIIKVSLTSWAVEPLLPWVAEAASLAVLSVLSTRWQQLHSCQPAASKGNQGCHWLPHHQQGGCSLSDLVVSFSAGI